MQATPISISLPVQHIDMSMAFYATLGFDVVGGSHLKDYAVIQNGKTAIGLYHGLSVLPATTLRTGWDPEIAPIDLTDALPALRRLLH